MVCFAETRDIFWWRVFHVVYDPLEEETEWLAEQKCDCVCNLTYKIREEAYLNNLAYVLRR